MTKRVYKQYLLELLDKVLSVKEHLNGSIQLRINLTDGDLLNVTHSDIELRYIISFEIRLNGEDVLPEEQFNIALKYIDELLKKEEHQ